MSDPKFDAVPEKTAELPKDTFKVHLTSTEQGYLGKMKTVKDAEVADGAEYPEEIPDVHEASEEAIVPGEVEKSVTTEPAKETPKVEPAKENNAGTEKPLSDKEVDDILMQILSDKPENAQQIQVETTNQSVQEQVNAEYTNETAAFSKEMEGMSPDEISAISTEVASIISSEEYSKWEKDMKYSAAQRAQLAVALAEKRKSKEINEIRTKAEQARLEQARNEVKVREEVKELTGVQRTSSETKPAAKDDILERFKQGDEDARARVLLGDDLNHLESSRRRSRR